MFAKKRGSFYKLCVTLLCMTAIFGGTFFFFYIRDSGTQREVQAHIDTLFSLSGELTSEEKQVFLSSVHALVAIMDKKLQQNPHSLPFISEEELTRIQQHTTALARQNPELAIHSHGPGGTHQHVYEMDPGEMASRIQEELANINAAIEEVEASAETSPSAKEALLSVLEHRRYFLMNHEKDFDDLEEKLIELSKADPSIVGVKKSHITGEYTILYPNMLTLKKRRTHHPDGTVEEVLFPASCHATDPEVGQLITSYLEALETLPPWEVPPPPEHKDLRLTIKTEDIYLNEAGETRTDLPPQTPEQIVEKSGEPSTETAPSDTYPDSIITEAEVDSWQGALEEIHESTDVEMAEMRRLFEEAIGIPLHKFLEMTDAEIEAEFRKDFSEAALENRITPSVSTDVFTEENWTSELRSQFSSDRFNRAIQTLTRYGPEEGLRQLKEVDPEVATYIEPFLQGQEK